LRIRNIEAIRSPTAGYRPPLAVVVVPKEVEDVAFPEYPVPA
jgi:hypothetical protein